MNFDFIEGLDENQIFELYNNSIDDNNYALSCGSDTVCCKKNNGTKSTCYCRDNNTYRMKEVTCYSFGYGQAPFGYSWDGNCQAGRADSFFSYGVCAR